MDDKQFINHFSAMLGVLITIIVLILIIAKALSNTHQEPDQAMQETIAERIRPVGNANVGEIPAAATATPQKTQPTVTAPAASPVDAEQIYQTVCAICHASGIANAPIYGNKAAWEPRLGNIELLYTNSLNGKGAMPPKGGRLDLSDEAIKATVDYMLDAVR